MNATQYGRALFWAGKGDQAAKDLVSAYQNGKKGSAERARQRTQTRTDYDDDMPEGTDLD